ncbi:hypothetical protein RUND412_011322 [Rhizina undulata]
MENLARSDQSIPCIVNVRRSFCKVVPLLQETDGHSGDEQRSPKQKFEAEGKDEQGSKSKKKKKDEKRDKPKGKAKKDSGSGESYPKVKLNPTQSEKEEARKEGHCLNCLRPGHKSNECYAKAKASLVGITAMKERWQQGRPGKKDPKKKKPSPKAKVSAIQASSSRITKFDSDVELDTEMLGNF